MILQPDVAQFGYQPQAFLGGEQISIPQPALEARKSPFTRVSLTHNAGSSNCARSLATTSSRSSIV
jgi:hypothetical protein